MGKTTKAIVGICSGVTLAIGTAAAAPLTPSQTINPATPEKNVQILDKTGNAIPPMTIKEGAKPGSKLMDNNLGRTPPTTVKVKENAKPGNQTATSLKVKEDSKAGQKMELTRR